MKNSRTVCFEYKNAILKEAPSLAEHIQNVLKTEYVLLPPHNCLFMSNLIIRSAFYCSVLKI